MFPQVESLVGLMVYGRRVTSIPALLSGVGPRSVLPGPLELTGWRQEQRCPTQAVGTRREPAPCPSSHRSFTFEGMSKALRQIMETTTNHRIF